MSVYLSGTSILLDGGSVATSTDCCCGGGGACCNLIAETCTIEASRDDCVASGGIYLGDGTTCTGVDCTCCPLFDPYTEIHFSGEVIGCLSGNVNVPEQIWTKNDTEPAGCNLSPQEFSKGLSCSCTFQSHNCFPFVEVDYVAIDETGGCADPFTFCTGCCLIAHIYCDGTVNLEASTDGFNCCVGGGFAALDLSGPYDLTAGPIDETLTATAGDTSIQFRFILSLA